MDERTLNDLLECSVCLDRLDTSSKVLPCQHTFCRKCLEVIVSSRHELRCPECRVLVEIKIDDLPPNVLLMRILEGMKNAAAVQNYTNISSNNLCKNDLTPAGNILMLQQRPVHNNTELSNNIGSAEQHPFQLQLQQQQKNRLLNEQQFNLLHHAQEPPQAQTSSEGQHLPTSSRRIAPHAFALYDFQSTESGDLNFRKNDVILLKRKLDVNWLIGESNGKEGAFPISYVQIIVPLPYPHCIALYDFKMGPKEEEGCLTFRKGTIIHVLRRVDPNWAEGRIGNCIGIFPIAFVELNSLAKQLLETGDNNRAGATANTNQSAPRKLPPIPIDSSVINPIESASSSASTITTPNSTCSSNSSSNSIPSSPVSKPTTSTQKNTSVEYRDVREKRHSLNGITAGAANLSIIHSNRHSAEILSIPDSSMSNNTQLRKPTTNIPNESRTLHEKSNCELKTNQPRENILKSSGLITLPWGYLALYPYKPKKSDELELKKGRVYIVTERCLDGWFKGKNWQDKSGVFPGNYVTPLRTKDQQQLIHQKKLNINNSQGHLENRLTKQISLVNQVQNDTHLSILSTNTDSSSLLPPELPPRSVAGPSSTLWAKPIVQYDESFCNKNDTKIHEANNAKSKLTSSSNKDTNEKCTAKDKEKEKKETSSAVSLMKRLTNIKRSKSPSSSGVSNGQQFQPNNKLGNDNSSYEENSSFYKTHQSTTTMNRNAMYYPVHVRSGSCPSQLLQSLPTDLTGTASSTEMPLSYGSQRIKGSKERASLLEAHEPIENTNWESSVNNGTSVLISTSANPSSNIMLNKKIIGNAATINHRKSHSLDANTISSQYSLNQTGGKVATPLARENRFRCIVPYPPNSDIELELNIGDLVYVHRKQKNGWYKGTHARTNKTGLFPASFVKPDI